MKWFIGLDQRCDGDFKPSALIALAWMIKSWEVRSLRGHARARLGYHVNQTYPLNTAQMLTGHAVQRALNINDGVSGQLALILIFDLNRHETVPCSFFGLTGLTV